MHSILWIISVTGVFFSLLPIALSQSLPQPDRAGDYRSNEAPLKRQNPPRPLQAGSLWQVVPQSLNCRVAPGTHQPILRQYQRGAILEAEVGRGGSDEVLLNALDAERKPWMAVRGKGVEDRCYVRANKRYIQPLLTHDK